jgi:DTW domain-containing protein YfiP
MHPKEAKRNRTGTGRIAHSGLVDSEILVGIDFTKNERLCQLLSDERYFPVLLYPDDKAWNAQKEGFKAQIGNKKLLAIIIDSTWFCSKKMIRLSTNIMALPKLTFAKSYRSIYTFKKEPSEECVSTIETCYYLIKELQEAKIVDEGVNPECLMTAFKELVKLQIQKENDRRHLRSLMAIKNSLKNRIDSSMPRNRHFENSLNKFIENNKKYELKKKVF